MAITFRQRFGGWRQLTNNAKPRLGEMPELADSIAQLEEIIDRAEALQQETEDLKGRFQWTARQRRETEIAGEQLRRRIVAALQFKLGFEDERLLGFGIEPRRQRVVRRRPAGEGATPPVVKPPATQEAAAEPKAAEPSPTGSS